MSFCDHCLSFTHTVLFTAGPFCQQMNACITKNEEDGRGDRISQSYVSKLQWL